MIEILALDVGQTGVKASLSSGSDTCSVPDLPGILSAEPLLPQVASHIRCLLSGRRAQAVAIGASGFGPKDSAAELGQLLAGEVERVIIAHDSITSYLGALGARCGAVVAAGTGAVTLAVGPSQLQRVDGWGHLLGDEGSGFWIGRAALAAVLKAHDGRGPATELTAAARAEFGELDGLYLQLQGDPNRVARIASWARRVAELAPRDAVCHQISRQAGRLLAGAVTAGIQRCDADPVASYVGNVFRNTCLRDSFVAELERLLPGIQVLEPAGNGLAGARLLPSLAPGTPLALATDHYTVTA